MRTPPFGSWYRKVLVRYPSELGKRGTRVNLFYFLLAQTRNVLCVWVCLCVDVCANIRWGVYTYRISLVRGRVDGRARCWSRRLIHLARLFPHASRAAHICFAPPFNGSLTLRWKLYRRCCRRALSGRGLPTGEVDPGDSGTLASHV